MVSACFHLKTFNVNIAARSITKTVEEPTTIKCWRVYSYTPTIERFFLCALRLSQSKMGQPKMTVSEMQVIDSKLSEHEVMSKDGSVHTFCFINDIPLNDTHHDMKVNYLEVDIQAKKL